MRKINLSRIVKLMILGIIALLIILIKKNDSDNKKYLFGKNLISKAQADVYVAPPEGCYGCGDCAGCAGCAGCGS